MKSLLCGAVFLILACVPRPASAALTLEVGFGETDITPKLGDKPIYLAGFGRNRKAVSVHDPLKCRAIVLAAEGKKIALASIDVVGFFHPNVVSVRKKLPGFDYVLVSSTHNHEGPDTLGLWGPNVFTRGVDPEYLTQLEERIAEAVRAADAARKPAITRLGTARDPNLLHDAREPFIKHDELVGIQFDDPQTKQCRGILVQWNCHPETLESKNTQISADFVGYTVKEIHEKHHCPVVYLTGTVGGLMTSMHVPVKNAQGKLLDAGTFEKTERYGRLVGQLAEKALASAKPIKLAPLEARHREIFVPMDNKAYQVARQVGVLPREAFLWTGDPNKVEPADPKETKKPLAIRTEVAWLRLGDLEMAAIPGEIYPELVLDKVQDPPDPGADFPDAPIEPAIYKQMRSPHRMIIGLANDEIGYIIPKRQWDEKPPFCYGRKSAQYGELNSVGPNTAPIICGAFKELATGHKGK